MSSLEKIAKKLFQDEPQRQLFLDCLREVSDSDQSLVWMGEPKEIWPTLSPLDFQPPWVQRVEATALGASPEHQRGEFYILDTSSVFSIVPLLDLGTPEIIFDACASPGGKSIMAWRALKPNLLFANEFVQKRLVGLISNFQRCQIQPSEVFHLSTQRIGEMFEQAFPLVLVDAPCSGQSLILKGEKVPGAFHAQTINGNAMRQRRILAELAPSVAPQGYMLYTTCTFSKEENEDIIQWFIKKFPQFQTCNVNRLEAYQSHLSDFPSYRLWPQSNEGAGSFTALLKNTTEGNISPLPPYKPVWRGTGNQI